MFDDIKGIVSIEDDVEPIFDTRRTRARSIESQNYHFQRAVHAGAVSQDAVEQWLTVSCFANDAVRRALAHLYPVPLGIDKKELVFVVIFQLSSDKSVEVKDQSRFVERFLVFIRNATDLGGEHIDGLKEFVEGLIAFTDGLVKIRDGLVSHRTQSRRHEEHRVTSMLMNGHFTRGNTLNARRDSGVGDADESILDFHA